MLKPIENRAFQEPFPAREPVIVEAETVDAVLLRELDLTIHHFRRREVVKPDIDRQLRLVMADELRQGPRHVRPLGETTPVPFVVLGEGVELGEIEGDEFRG